MEYIVVNDILASPFAINHRLTNMYYNIYRYLSSVMSNVKYSTSKYLAKYVYHVENSTEVKTYYERYGMNIFIEYVSDLTVNLMA